MIACRFKDSSNLVGGNSLSRASGKPIMTNSASLKRTGNKIINSTVNTALSVFYRYMRSMYIHTGLEGPCCATSGSVLEMIWRRSPDTIPKLDSRDVSSSRKSFLFKLNPWFLQNNSI